NYAFGRMNPWGYHLTSLLLHAANAVLFYLVARRLLAAAVGASSGGSSRPGSRSESEPPTDPLTISAGALVAALLFAVPPQRVESVAWVSDRSTLLCATFYLLAVLAYLTSVASSDVPRRRWWRAASLLAFAAALLSKGMACSLPLSLLVLDVYPLRRSGEGWRRLLLEKAPYGALAIGGAMVALMARSEGAAFSGYVSYGLVSRIAL